METHFEKIDVPELDQIWVRPGTAPAVLAGAANHWHREALRLKRQLGKSRLGSFICGVISGVLLLGLPLAWWM